MEPTQPFVPADFEPPRSLDHPEFRLRPLGPEHNESDYAAWIGSMAHIRATPGWANQRWPRFKTLDENRDDLVQHAQDFAERTGFTYTVLADREGREVVIGCVYIYPDPDAPQTAMVRSWVRAADAALDAELWRTVSDWLAADWPFQRVDYAPRKA
ncbi:MAG: N-acetyltransferase [Chloroflexota bacterium]|nr:N-acetyltransferase [Chloroflexota bacterium]